MRMVKLKTIVKILRRKKIFKKRGKILKSKIIYFI